MRLRFSHFIRSPYVKSGTLVAAGYGALRYLAPFLLKTWINAKLRRSTSVGGRIGRLDLNIFRGVAVAQNADFVLGSDAGSGPALHVDRAAIRLHAAELFKGGVAASADIRHPSVLVRPAFPSPNGSSRSGPPRPPHPAAGGVVGPPPWNASFRRAFPFRLRQLRVERGEIHVQNLPGQNGADVRVENIDATVRNVTNSEKLARSTLATLDLRARAMASGALTAHVDADPMAIKPVFSAEVALRGLELSELNPLLRERAGTEFRAGTLDCYAEAAGANGALKGYVKPIVDHVDVARARGAGVRRGMKGFTAKAAAALFRNRRKNRIAAKIPFAGAIETPDPGVFAAVRSAIRNAFIKALPRGLENSVSIMDTARAAERGGLVPLTKRPTRRRTAWDLVRTTFAGWSADQAPRLAASLSYYTAFSIAPLLLLMISIAGLVFGESAVEGRIFGELSGLIGDQAARTVQSMISAARNPASSALAMAVSVIALLFGASRVMKELNLALNTMWGGHPRAGLFGLVRRRLMSFAMVLAIGFLLLISLVASAALATLGKFIGDLLPVPEGALHALDFSLSFLVVTTFFAAMFKFLPDVEIGWKEVWVGAVVTAAFFTAGKLLLGLYLGKGAAGSAYGTAGSVLMLLLWVYYSAQIFYLGAEFTKAYSNRFGSGIAPSAPRPA